MSDDFSSYYDEYVKVVTRRFLRKYEWLINPSRRHSIELVLLQDIVDFLGDIPNLKKEGEALNLGLMIKNTQVQLETPPIKRKPFHISKFSNFLHLKNIVDGNPLCYLIDKKGMVVIEQIPKKLLKISSRLTLRNASHVFQTITFYVGEFGSEIFDSGKTIQINRKGVWLKPCSLPLEDLAKEGFPLGLLKLVTELCKRMSEMNKGATFVIIRDDSPKYCSDMISEYQVEKFQIDGVQRKQVINLASIDGATILNTKNELIKIGQKLEAPPSFDFFKETGRGTRHNSASLYSKAVDSVVFVVSEDGPISVYFEGELFARCFEELFGPT
jgi:hypothetical protein